MWTVCKLVLFQLLIASVLPCKEKDRRLGPNEQLKRFRNLTGVALDNAIIDQISNLTKNSQRVQLRNMGISQITQNVFKKFPQILVIDLKSNEIVQVENEAFVENSELEKIDLMDNRLGKISKNFFAGEFPELEEINLSYNLIASIEAGSFDKLLHLESIDLSSNCLRHLHSDAFKKCPGLRMVFMSENEIDKIEISVFNPKTELKVLNLSKNKLDFIPELELKTIKHFELSFNEIHLLDLNYNEEKKKSADVIELVLAFNKIRECTELEERRTDILFLDLTHNAITDLDDFPSFLNLEVLILAQNNISDLSLHNFEERFPSLKVLNIRDNAVLDCADFRYARNNLQSLIITADSSTTQRCHSNKSATESDYDYEDVLIKEVRQLSRSIMKQLLHNYSLLIVLLSVLIACVCASIIIQALKLKLKLHRTKESLIDQMEL